MGTTRRNFIVKKDAESSTQLDVSFLIDSGAGYSLLPEKQLDALGIHPHGEIDLELADGTRIRRKLGGAYFEYCGEGGFTPVIFGEEGEEPLLGALTLEALRLVHNPYKRELYPQKVVRL